MKAVHNTAHDHKCMSCPHYMIEEIRTEKALHNKHREYQCVLCPFSANQKGNLERHVKAIHEKLRDHRFILSRTTEKSYESCAYEHP